jgi:hypothetical protein
MCKLCWRVFWIPAAAAALVVVETKKAKDESQNHHNDAYYYLCPMNYLSRAQPPRYALRGGSTKSVNAKGSGCAYSTETTPPTTPFPLWRFKSKPTMLYRRLLRSGLVWSLVSKARGEGEGG